MWSDIHATSWLLLPSMVESKTHIISTMQAIEDINIVGVNSASKQEGQDNIVRVINILKPGGIIEFEVDVLGFRSGAFANVKLGESHADYSSE